MSGKAGISDVEVVETGKVELKQPLAIMGFAGAGLVGGIAVSHIIDKLEMSEIAHVQSVFTSPAVVFLDGKLRQPFRIHSNREGNICAVVCEIPLPSSGVYHIAGALLKWVEEKGAKELVVLDGVSARGLPKKRKAFCVAEPEKLEECEKKGVKMAHAGIIRGISGSILNECLNRKITGVAFLVPAVAFMPDIEGAVTLIETLNDVYGLNVETADLLSKAADLKQKLKTVAERHQRMRKAEERRGDIEGTYVV